jgi:hypothetical protein
MNPADEAGPKQRGLEFLHECPFRFAEGIIYRKKLLDWYVNGAGFRARVSASMVVRIRFRKGPRISRKRRKNQRLALAIAALLPAAAMCAGALAMWRVAADLNLTGSFAISDGIFSHWLVWLAAAVLLQLCARALNRYGRSGDPAASSDTAA